MSNAFDDLTAGLSEAAVELANRLYDLPPSYHRDCFKCVAAFLRTQGVDAEVFTLTLPDGTARHYDIAAARYFAARGREVSIDLTELAGPLARYECDEAHVDHVPLVDTLLVGAAAFPEGVRHFLLDRSHRAARALRDGWTAAPAHVLTEGETAACEFTPGKDHTRPDGVTIPGALTALVW